MTVVELKKCANPSNFYAMEICVRQLLVQTSSANKKSTYTDARSSVLLHRCALLLQEFQWAPTTSTRSSDISLISGTDSTPGQPVSRVLAEPLQRAFRAVRCGSVRLEPLFPLPNSQADHAVAITHKPMLMAQMETAPSARGLDFLHIERA